MPHVNGSCSRTDGGGRVLHLCSGEFSTLNKTWGVSAMRNQVLVTAVAAAVFVGCGVEPEPPSPEPESSMPEADASMPTPGLPPAMIVAERGGFIPEGVEYDTANGRILTGSLSEGSIFHIHNDAR